MHSWHVGTPCSASLSDELKVTPYLGGSLVLGSRTLRERGVSLSRSQEPISDYLCGHTGRGALRSGILGTVRPPRGESAPRPTSWAGALPCLVYFTSVFIRGPEPWVPTQPRVTSPAQFLSQDSVHAAKYRNSRLQSPKGFRFFRAWRPDGRGSQMWLQGGRCSHGPGIGRACQ